MNSPHLAVIFTISSIISSVILYLCMGYYATTLTEHPSFWMHTRQSGGILIWPLFEHFKRNHILLLVWCSSITLQGTILVQLRSNNDLCELIRTTVLPISLGCLHSIVAYTYAVWGGHHSEIRKPSTRKMMIQSRRSSRHRMTESKLDFFQSKVRDRCVSSYVTRRSSLL